MSRYIQSSTRQDKSEQVQRQEEADDRLRWKVSSNSERVLLKYFPELLEFVQCLGRELVIKYTVVIVSAPFVSSFKRPVLQFQLLLRPWSFVWDLCRHEIREWYSQFFCICLFGLYASCFVLFYVFYVCFFLLCTFCTVYIYFVYFP